jgi:hypothetical protein
MNAVLSTTPATSIVVELRKPEPVTVNVIPGAPAPSLAGLTEVIAGVISGEVGGGVPEEELLGVPELQPDTKEVRHAKAYSKRTGIFIEVPV